VSPVDARVAVLLQEMRRDWESVRTHAQRAGSTDPASGAPQAAYVALSLDHAYQAFETMLSRLERALGLPERAGVGWDAAILADASVEVPKLRPAVFPRAALADWEAILRFRHFLRHAYTLDLEADRLAENAARLARAVDASGEAVGALFDALEQTLGS
jgi:hypothetical protein